MNNAFTSVCALFVGLALSGAAVAQHHASSAAAQQAAGPRSSTVTASDCWIRQMPPPTASGGFFVLHNGGTQDAVLTAAHSPDYGMVMLHQTTQEDGISKMSMVEQVAVTAGGQLDFKPGSYHVMLEEPRAGLHIGDHADLDLILKDGTTVRAVCELKSPKSAPPMAGHAH